MVQLLLLYENLLLVHKVLLFNYNFLIFLHDWVLNSLNCESIRSLQR